MKNLATLILAGLIYVFLFSGDDEKQNAKPVSIVTQPQVYSYLTASTSDKYAVCYGKMTAAHKKTGLHSNNRSKSIEIKEKMCKIASTSTTGNGIDWIK